MLHFDGSTWTRARLPVGIEVDLRALWGNDSADIWAVGTRGALLHFEGTSWSRVELPPLPGAADANGDSASFGSSAGDAATASGPDLDALTGRANGTAWAVGAAGIALRFDGTSWTAVPTGSGAALHGIYADGDGQAWAVGDGGTILRFDDADGGVWAKGPAVTTANLFAISGSAPDDVWTAGDIGTLLHFNGKSWVKVALTTNVPLRSVWAVSRDRVWLAGDEGTVLKYAVPADAGDADAGAMSDAALIADARPDGQTGPRPVWSSLPTGLGTALFAIAGTPTGLWVAGAAGTVASFDGHAWTRHSAGTDAARLACAVSPSGNTTLIVGDESLVRTHETWSPVPAATARALYGVSLVDDTHGWAVGTAGTILQWNAATPTHPFTAVDQSPTDQWLRSVWGQGNAAGWIVGSKGTILGLLNGSTWQVIASGATADLIDVWGSAADDVWAVGEGGTLLHWRGSSWTKVPLEMESGARPDLHGVWGSAAADVWAVGSGGAILHYDGATWTSVASGASYTLNGVWGSGSMDVWTVGSGGTILRFDGHDWQSQESGTRASLNSIAGDGNTVFAIGDQGVVLRREQR
jgi:hypothetical protein